MKSLKVLIATLILGSSTLALAEPMVRDHRSDSRFDERFDDRDRYDDRTDNRTDPWSRDHLRMRRMAPVTLASNMEVSLRRPVFVNLSGMRRLRFDADEGHAYIHSIILTYSNGAQQTIDVRQRVTSRSMPLTVDIDSRATGVYIYASTRGRGSLDLVGLRR
ncbi:MAG TPA: hypothetical protein VL326_31760 [Kofleriaceae bacterium]|nr:hypothetical protein [Kofleriaceae bacterium]